MSPRLIIAFALSLVLHGSLLIANVFTLPPSHPAPALRASLRPPPAQLAPQESQLPADMLLKNTLDPEASPPAEAAPQPPPKPSPARRPDVRREVRTAQRKLSEHVFYPPEAIARGLEGEVRLIIALAPDGRVDDVHVGVSSGHPILDNAAIKAAYAMGQVPGATSRQLILPVIFRLQ